MPSINLLPWREAERKKRQRDFGVALGGSVIAAIAVIMVTMVVYSQMIAGQENRVLRVRLDHAFRNHVGDEFERIGCAGVFGLAVVVEIEAA